MKLLGACDGFHYLNNCISPQSDEILVTSTSMLDLVLMGNRISVKLIIHVTF